MSQWKHAKQGRWYAKLLADPVRLSAFREKTRAASRARYRAERNDPRAIERHRATRRKTAKAQWQKAKVDPAKLAKRREHANKRCVELRDEYVAERLKLPPDACPRELLELKRAHLQLQRELRRTHDTNEH